MLRVEGSGFSSVWVAEATLPVQGWMAISLASLLDSTVIGILRLYIDLQELVRVSQ